jgi:hypothetical protein
LVLVGAVALMVGTLSACFGPPPPSTDPHDVLVVGDSVAFSFGCVLGDTLPGSTGWSCPARPGYSTKNMAIGACTTYGTEVLLYNAGRATVPNCDTTPAGFDNMTWQQAADHFTPKVVVINAAGWEIVDRWVGDTGGAPNSQFGTPGCSIQSPCNPEYQTAAIQYTSSLNDAIHTFLDRGAKVVVATAPYADPLSPEPDPNSTPAGLGCSYWEPYPSTAPTASGGNCKGDATAGQGGQWRAPYPGLTYRSGTEKYNQINEAIQFVKDQYFGGNSNVVIFPFKQHFNGPSNVYTDYVCPPPNDRTVAPDPLTHKCIITNPMPGLVDAVLARDPDRGHLSPAGAFDVLQPYLEPCVKALIPVSGGDLSKCS